MKLKTGIALLLGIIFCSLLTFAQNTITHSNHFEIPELKPHEDIVSHVAYTLSYNEIHEQANWVAYKLTKEETNGVIKRTNKFIVDPLIKTESANNMDYIGSGYDRGHLAPAGDMGWSIVSMDESFYYSNMSPQEPSFNRGIWKHGEELVRDWAKEYGSIYIVTGPILKDSLPTIGLNKVSVPIYYYKVILNNESIKPKAIGFIIPNKSSNQMLQTFAVSVDSVEKLTGINFFPLLPDDIEEETERNLHLNDWSWKNTSSKSEVDELEESENLNQHQINPAHIEIKEHHSSIENTGSVQCSKKTIKGKRCKNITTNASGKCHLHE
jgi:endonuclease G